jgi:D-alanyl-D-alanine carboxypeptidase
VLQKLVSDLVGPSVSGAAACFAIGPDETVAAAGDVEADDVFGVGSVTKTFVAAAALRLAAEGVIGLDDSAARWCELAPADVTVRMLLDHTSRIPDYVAVPGVIEAHQREPERVWDPRELVGLAPGRSAEWRYSNTNYVLLGLVLEAASSKSLDAALDELLFAPLDLRSTRLPRSPAASFAWAAGGIESTPPEVCRFLGALLRGELVDTTELRRTVEVTDNVEFDRYGAGIAVMSSIVRLADSPCGPAWGHLGFGVNESAAALGAPDGSRCLAVCTRGALDESGWRVLAESVWPIFCHSEAAP